MGEVERDRKGQFDERFSMVRVVDLDREIVHAAAILHNHLNSINQKLYIADTLIAATALVYDLPLLTTNVRHFERVPDLRLLPLPARRPPES